MVYLLTTEAEIVQKSGAGVSASVDTAFMECSETRGVAVMNGLCRYNWATNTLSLSSVSGILSDVASSFVAIEAISYDMSGYTSPREAEDMINVLRDGMLRNLAILKDKKNQKWMQTDGA